MGLPDGGSVLHVRDRVKELRRVKASDLKPCPQNWRTHPQAQQDALRGLLAEIGYADALLARELADGSLMLIDGHLRAETTPGMLVPVLVLDVDEAEAAKLLATLDPLAAMAGADAARLEALLDSISTSSSAVQEMLDGLKDANPLPLPEAGSGGDEFDATPEDGPTRTALGDLWVIGGKHRLLVGDCTLAENVARLLGGEKFSCMWTDPPYGVCYGAKNEFLNAIARGNHIQEPIQGDQQNPEELRAFLVAAFTAAYAHGTAGATAYVAAPPGPLHTQFIEAMNDAGIPYRHQLVWVKNQFVLGRCDYHYKHEPILYGWKDDGPHQWYGEAGCHTVFEIDKPRKNDLHPTMKPVELVERMLANSTPPTGLVYDPFLGSGTTLIAAHRLGRRCFGCELDPKYADVMLKRAEAEGLECAREGEEKPAKRRKKVGDGQATRT